MSDRGTMQVCLISAACFLRALPLFFRASPRTPLRVMGVIAFDVLHVLRYARPLPRAKVSGLALFLDFQGCANAAWDHKDLRALNYQAVRHDLKASGLGPCAVAYLRRLHALESTRPVLGGDRRHFDDVRRYRESVVQLALTTAAALALAPACRDQDIRAAQDDADVAMLVRILMQCQIIDDAWDYTEDVAAGLPSLLTAPRSLPQAIELTAGAAWSYAATVPPGALLPMRAALWIITAASALALARVARVETRRTWELTLDT